VTDTTDDDLPELRGQVETIFEGRVNDDLREMFREFLLLIQADPLTFGHCMKCDPKIIQWAIDEIDLLTEVTD